MSNKEYETTRDLWLDCECRTHLDYYVERMKVLMVRNIGVMNLVR